mmetsp:Transcript_2167/g.3546  ORF Transcript_2167/g.3546 Transcript_2167/m.3546 type:complete len:522 (-) Transcript_2167:197-1762(-)|eukprot:CAMPEP_0205907838 /NCGR_PEP_ID=MMETSP1325-20131115/2807_1 /ASSEMBLY_ACC=CAM_ASM_000708 /TAXON_ID=236786 /ORGANISM="Florenciella sp., Strain RCC1007" /LENGTH=521 /DNA_ID=CAMNT_0053273981 /DNA_START=78 /DNA_END=1643 /DNA_ORIENTATION=+
MGAGAASLKDSAPNGRGMHSELGTASPRRKSRRRSSSWGSETQASRRRSSLNLKALWSSAQDSEDENDFPVFSDSPPKACVFALSGVLLDTTLDVGEAAKIVLAEMIGHESVEQMDPLLFQTTEPETNHESGSAWEVLVRQVLAAAGIAEDDDGIEAEMYRERVRERLLALSRHTQPCKGARSLIAHLEHNRIPVAATSSSTTCEFALQRGGNEAMLNAFPYIICADSPGVAQQQPAPDMHLEASRLMEVSPADCIAFESTYTGALAARKAGMRVVLVGRSTVMSTAVANRLAAAQIATLADFDPMTWSITQAQKRLSFCEAHSPALRDLTALSTEALMNSMDSSWNGGARRGTPGMDDSQSSRNGWSLDGSESSRRRSFGSPIIWRRERAHSDATSSCSEREDHNDTVAGGAHLKAKLSRNECAPSSRAANRGEHGATRDLEVRAPRHSKSVYEGVIRAKDDADKCPEELKDRRVSIKKLFILRDPGNSEVVLNHVSNSSLLSRRSQHLPHLGGPVRDGS